MTVTSIEYGAERIFHLTLNTSDVRDQISPFMYGSGIETYMHAMYGGLWSNLLYDDSFEDATPGQLPSISKGSGWFTIMNSTAQHPIVIQGHALNGKQLIQLAKNPAVNVGYAVSKKTTGIFFHKSHLYEGYVWLRNSGNIMGKVKVTILCAPINEWNSSKWSVLSVSTIENIPPINEWNKYNITLISSSDCLQSIQRKNDERGMGLFTVTAEEGMIGMDEVMLEPGPWGRFNSSQGRSMHIRADLAQAFLGQHPTVMRMGGSMTNDQPGKEPGFRFKYMVGPKWARPPTYSNWIAHTSWGFGIFEWLEFCESSSIYPVLSINYAEDMEGFLEYLYGSPGTRWGSQRVADGHPKPYMKFAIICSNEEPQQETQRNFKLYIGNFTRWYTTTKKAALKLGVWPLVLGVSIQSGAGRFYDPNNEDPFRGGGKEMTDAIMSVVKDGELWWDQHGAGDDVQSGWSGRNWTFILERLANDTSIAGKMVKPVMLEENGGQHTLARALGHVSNSLTLQRMGSLVPVQTAAGILMPGSEGAGGQWQIKFNADDIVFAPHWYAQKLLSTSHQPNLLGGYIVTVGSEKEAAIPQDVDWMATLSNNKCIAVFRVLAPSANNIPMIVTLGGGKTWANTVMVEQLRSSNLQDVNDFSSPHRVIPTMQNATLVIESGLQVLHFNLDPFSFTIFKFTCSQSPHSGPHRFQK